MTGDARAGLLGGGGVGDEEPSQHPAAKAKPAIPTYTARLDRQTLLRRPDELLGVDERLKIEHVKGVGPGRRLVKITTKETFERKAAGALKVRF